MTGRTARVLAKQLPGDRDSGGRQRLAAFVEAYATVFERVVVYGFGDGRFAERNVEVRSFAGPRPRLDRYIATSAFAAKWHSRDLAAAFAADVEPADHVHVDFPQMAVNLPAGRRPDVVDFHNIEARLMASRTDEWAMPARLVVEPEIRRLARLERRIAHSARLVTACSADDATVLRSYGARTMIVPNGVSALPQQFVTAPGNGEVAFVGSMDYGPNREAVSWLFSDVWPAVQALRPQSTLVVAGRNAAEVHASVPADLRVVVMDSPPSIADVYRRADVCIVPLRSGAGTKIKLLEALAHGRAVVSTSVGLEGLSEVERWVDRADTVPEFAEAVARRLDAVAAGGGAETFEFARSTFSWPSRLSTLMDHLASEHVRGIR